MKHNTIFTCSVKLHEKYADHTVYYLDGSSDKGLITDYEICPGIHVMYNDYCACEAIYKSNSDGGIFAVSYCKEGRLEWKNNQSGFEHIDTGYVHVHNGKDLSKCISLVSENFKGISIYINFHEVKCCINQCFLFFGIDLENFQGQVFAKSNSMILPSQKNIQKVFEEIQLMRTDIDRNMLRMKVIEILSYISKLEIRENISKNIYFRSSQIEKVRQVKEYLCENIETRITLEELSHKFNIPLKTLKLCFKQQYGQSVYAYSRNFRLQNAAKLLKDTDKNVLEVGILVGFSSPSKFSKAFKEKFGITPLRFKKNKV